MISYIWAGFVEKYITYNTHSPVVHECQRHKAACKLYCRNNTIVPVIMSLHMCPACCSADQSLTSWNILAKSVGTLLSFVASKFDYGNTTELANMQSNSDSTHKHTYSLSHLLHSCIPVYTHKIVLNFM